MFITGGVSINRKKITIDKAIKVCSNELRFISYSSLMHNW